MLAVDDGASLGSRACRCPANPHVAGEFVVYDDQSTPATAVRLYEKLITEDKVDAVTGPYSSPSPRRPPRAEGGIKGLLTEPPLI
jgi:hypothetical protein